MHEVQLQRRRAAVTVLAVVLSPLAIVLTIAPVKHVADGPADARRGEHHVLLLVPRLLLLSLLLLLLLLLPQPPLEAHVCEVRNHLHMSLSMGSRLALALMPRKAKHP